MYKQRWTSFHVEIGCEDATKQEKEQLRALVRKNVLLQYFGTDEDGIGAKNISSKEVEKKTDIMPHHEVLLRLDAMDLERGMPSNALSMTLV